MFYRRTMSLLLAALVAANATVITSFAIEGDNGTSPGTTAGIETPNTTSNDTNSDSNSGLSVDPNAQTGTDIEDESTSEEEGSSVGANSSNDNGDSSANPDRSQTEEPAVPSQDAGREPEPGADSSESNPGDKEDEEDETKDPPSSGDADKPETPPSENPDNSSENTPSQPETPEDPSETPSTDPEEPDSVPTPKPEEPQEPEPTVPEPSVDSSPTVEENTELPELALPAEVDENGEMQVEELSPVDFIFPSKVGDTNLHCIRNEAFKGCPYFHSVTIPKEITEIGEDAFAKCTGLEYIILEGRSNIDDMTLGNNWNGSAKIIFGLVEVSANTDSDTVEDDNSQEVTNPETDPSNDDDEENTSADTENDSAADNALDENISSKDEVDLPPEPENDSTDSTEYANGKEVLAKPVLCQNNDTATAKDTGKQKNNDIMQITKRDDAAPPKSENGSEFDNVGYEESAKGESVS